MASSSFRAATLSCTPVLSLAAEFSAIKERLQKQFALQSGVIATPLSYVDAGHYLACQGASQRRSCARLASIIIARQEERERAAIRVAREKAESIRRKSNAAFKAAMKRAVPVKSYTNVYKKARPTRRGLIKARSRAETHAHVVTLPEPSVQKANLAVLVAAVKRMRLGASCRGRGKTGAGQVGQILPTGSKLNGSQLRWLRLNAQRYLKTESSVRHTYKRIFKETLFEVASSSAASFDNFRAGLEAKLRHNKEMHSANGNIVPYIESIDDVKDRSREQQMLAEYKTPQTMDIANAVIVPTEYLFAADLESFANRLGARTFDLNLLDLRFDTDILEVRDRFLKTAPRNSGAVPSEVVETTSFSVTASVADHPVKVNHLAPAQRNDLGGEMLLKNQFGAIEALFSPNFSVADVVAADSVMASHRFTGNRGNRQVLGWEASAANRASDLRNMARLDLQGQSYYRAAFRLWSAYLDASLDDNFTTPMTQANPLTAEDCVFDAVSDRAHQRIRLIPLSSYAQPGAAGAVTNPEGGLFSPTQPNESFDSNLDELEAGTAAFIDASQISENHLRWLIWALAPADPHTAWSWDFPANGGKPAGRRASYLANYRENPDGSVGGTPRIFVHLGNARLPQRDAFEHSMLGRPAAGPNGPIAAEPRLSAWSQKPSRAAIRGVLFHLIAKHHAGRDVWDALDAVLFRVHQKHLRDIPSRANNAPAISINSFGNDDYCMPRDFTSTAFFDVFRSPTDMSTDSNEVMAYLDLRSNMFVWTGVLASHSNFVSLNWASYAFSLMGREWACWNRVTKAIAPGTPQYRRNIVSQMLQRLSDTDLNPWAVMHASATGHMYGFRPIDRTISTTHMAMAPVWHASSPFVSNAYVQMWMVKMLPLHMLLPLAGSVPTWPEGEPISASPSADRHHYEARLARSLPLFSGRAWVQDGGMMANAQHYAACWQPTNSNGGDFNARTPGLRIGSWTSPFQYEWPRNPVTFVPSYMDTPGSTFGNYLMPGSLWNYTTDNNRVKALGVKISPETPPAESYSAWDRWTRMSCTKEQGTVAIAYIPPPAFLIQREPVNDFSLLIWGNPVSSAYEGMSFASTAPREALPPPPRDIGTVEHRTTLPAHLANHNDPHVPGARGREGRRHLTVKQALAAAAAEEASARRAKLEAERLSAIEDRIRLEVQQAAFNSQASDQKQSARWTNYGDPEFAPPDRAESAIDYEEFMAQEAAAQDPPRTPRFPRRKKATTAPAQWEGTRNNQPDRNIFSSNVNVYPSTSHRAVPEGNSRDIQTAPPVSAVDQDSSYRGKTSSSGRIAGNATSGVTYENKNPTDQQRVLAQLASLANSAAGLGRTGLTPVALKDKRYVENLLTSARLPSRPSVGAVLAHRGSEPKAIVDGANDAAARDVQQQVAKEKSATQAIIPPPAPAIPPTGEGNDHFPGSDAAYFAQLAEASSAMLSGGGGQSEN